jgi:esterase
MAATAQPGDKTIAVNGLKIHYLDWGNASKPPLILLHGIARVAHAFDHVAPHFVDDFHVLAIDMRGHGDSDWHPDGAYLVEDYTSDIEALIEQLGLRNLVLWGASTGGRVVQMVAGRHPEWVSGVIVEDVGPERPAAISNRRGDRMAKEANGWATFDEMLVQVKAENPRTPAPVLRNLAQHGSKVLANGRRVWKRDPAILKGFIPTELWTTVRKIKAPIIYVVGGASNIVPTETQRELKAALSQAQVVTMPGLGHYPSDENVSEFLTIVDRFLAADSMKN